MQKPERIQSVDLLRGVTVALMILVNNPGSWEYIYAPFQHAHWHGCTPTDLVFPFFLYIVGISISYALGNVKYDTANRSKVFLKIFKRSAILFGLGLFLSGFGTWFWEFSTWRILGVLQRISIVFFFAASLYILFDVRKVIYTAIVILVGYWLVMMLIPAPGLEAGSLEVGKNLAAFVDLKVLGTHCWKWSKTWDPEGVLSTFPAIVTALIGVLVGEFLKSNNTKEQKVIYLFVAGALMVVAGLFWDLGFPINKALWTSSYVLYTAGIATNCLAFSYWLIDLKGYQKGLAPFKAFGANAITAYMFSETLSALFYTITFNVNGKEESLKGLIWNELSFSWLSPYVLSLILAILWVLLAYVPIKYMYDKKIFVKV